MLVRRGYGLRAYDFYFLFNAEPNKTVEAMATIRRPKTVQYRTEAARKWDFRHCTAP